MSLAVGLYGVSKCRNDTEGGKCGEGHLLLDTSHDDGVVVLAFSAALDGGLCRVYTIALFVCHE